MLIIGAKGFAKEVLEIFHQLGKTENIGFYDDVSPEIGDSLYGIYPILKSKDEILVFFAKYGSEFTIGIGNPILRKKMKIIFKELGGVFASSISPYSKIGNYGNQIDEGCNIMTGTVITNDVKIGAGVLLNLNSTIGHDCIIGDFVELSPGVHVSGNCIIGSFSQIGSNATILPKIKIGKNVIIGAGAVVTKDIPDNCVAFGSPAKIIRTLEPMNL